MKIPDLDNLIKAIECPEWKDSVCKVCPYNYQYFDDSGDHGFWTCNDAQIKDDALFYLKLYQYLIGEQKNGN